MAFEVYKKGQGMVARLAAFVAVGLLIVFGAVRFYATFNRPGRLVLVEGLPVVGDVSAYKVTAFVLAAVGLLATWWFLNRPKNAELLIETEGEMRKVSWPTLPEVWNATVIVALVTVTLALTMFGLDELLRKILFLVFGAPEQIGA
jgi:preprotein translocase SecE subunit